MSGELTDEERELLKTEPMFRAGTAAEARVHRVELEESGLKDLHDVIMGFAGWTTPPTVERAVRWLQQVYLPTRRVRFGFWLKAQGRGLRDAWLGVWEPMKPVLPWFLALVTLVAVFVGGGVLTELLGWRWLS